MLSQEEESTILQREKDLRTRLEVMLKQKRERKQELKTLQERDQDLCDLLCMTPYSIDSNSVPSLEELDRFRRHLAALAAEKVWGVCGAGGVCTCVREREKPLWPDASWPLALLLSASRGAGERSLSASSGRSYCVWRSWIMSLTPASSGMWCVRMRTPSAYLWRTLLLLKSCCSRYGEQWYEVFHAVVCRAILSAMAPVKGSWHW